MAELTESDIQKIAEAIEQTNKPQKKKMEFSKLWLIGWTSFTVGFVALSYVLSFFDKNPLESLSSTIITTMCTVDAASFGGYALQNCVRAYCEDKFCGGNYKNNSNQ